MELQMQCGRLQEVEIQLLDETLAPNFPSGTDLPSTSRNPVPQGEEGYDTNQVRSPIRSLSEDRLHVSLRLGSLFPETEEESALHMTRSTAKSSAPTGTSQPATKKRAIRSPVQGVELKEGELQRFKAHQEGK